MTMTMTGQRSSFKEDSRELRLSPNWEAELKPNQMPHVCGSMRVCVCVCVCVSGQKLPEQLKAKLFATLSTHVACALLSLSLSLSLHLCSANFATQQLKKKKNRNEESGKSSHKKEYSKRKI